MTERQQTLLLRAARIGAFLWRFRKAVAVILVAAALLVAWKFLTLHSSLFTPMEVTVGKVSVTDIAPSRKLKVLSWYKEVMVSQARQHAGLFSLDEQRICAVYPARLDLGIDLTECDSTWYVERDDSVWVTLPPVTILNRDRWLVSDAERRIPIEQGTWSADDKKDLSTRANALMLWKCEQAGCWARAEEQARRTVSDILTSLGKHNVSVYVLPRRRSPGVTLPAALAEARRSNPYIFLTLTDGSHCLRYRNGSVLTYSGLSYAELFALADLYYTFHTDDHYSVSRRGSHVDFAHRDKAVDSSLFTLHSSLQTPRDSERIAAQRLLAVLHRDIFLSAPLSLTYHEQDRYGHDLWTVEK